MADRELAGDPAAQISIEIIAAPDRSNVVVVTVDGEVDILTEPTLRSSLLEGLDAPVVKAVVVDMSGVTFFSSGGIAVLAEAGAAAQERAVSLVLAVPAGSAPHRPLKMMGMSQMLDIHPTLDAALAAEVPRQRRS